MNRVLEKLGEERFSGADRGDDHNLATSTSDKSFGVCRATSWPWQAAYRNDPI